MQSRGFEFDDNFSAIVITGGPCAGKTTALSFLRRNLEEAGFLVAVCPEMATDLIVAGLPPWADWNDPLDFQVHLLRASLERENRMYKMMRELKSDKHRVLLCDRGIRDAEAYITEDEYLEVLERCGLDPGQTFARYKAVIHMVTAADGALPFYTLENNTARTESPELAIERDHKTRRSWVAHRHFFVIDNSTNFSKKLVRTFSSFARVLGMPEPMERERKFRVLNLDSSMIPPDAIALEITQDYLISNGKGERRIRRTIIRGNPNFTFTEKIQTKTSGERIERERIITPREYEQLLSERDQNTNRIQKIRHCFHFDGRKFEVDQYEQPLHETMVEIEIGDSESMNVPIKFPPNWRTEEVTGNPLYDNRTIAQK